jgi:hypothetical protein
MKIGTEINEMEMKRAIKKNPKIDFMKTRDSLSQINQNKREEGPN